VELILGKRPYEIEHIKVSEFAAKICLVRTFARMAGCYLVWCLVATKLVEDACQFLQFGFESEKSHLRQKKRCNANRWHIENPPCSQRPDVVPSLTRSKTPWKTVLPSTSERHPPCRTLCFRSRMRGGRVLALNTVVLLLFRTRKRAPFFRTSVSERGTTQRFAR
jgi:hypothetical protein